jgi:mannitol-1-phosphate 5-dehydrogenase
MYPKPLCIAVGAGSIGRSVTGFVFLSLGCELVYVDVVPTVVDALNRDQYYTIRDEEAHPERIRRIGPVRALLADDPEVKALANRASFLCTSVGAKGMWALGETLADWLRGRDLENGPTLSILLMENNHACEQIIRDAIRRIYGSKTNAVSIHRTSIERMTKMTPRSDGSADVVSEPFIPIILSKDALADSPMFSDSRYFMLTDRLEKFYDRKLYINNLGHAAMAYMGLPKGYHTTIEALGDSQLLVRLRRVLMESSRMLCRRYGFSREELEDHVENLIQHRYGNTILNDSLIRLGRDPVRKLGPNERLIGCAHSCLSCGVEPEAIIEIILLAMRYPDMSDAGAQQLHRIMKEGGVPEILTQVCRLEPHEPLYQRILKRSKNDQYI